MKIKLLNHYIILFLLLFPFYYTTAQVTIGDMSEPNRGALLDLKESNTSNAKNANSKQGMLLPRVNLKAIDVITIERNSNTLIGEEKIHVGLLVYNLKDDGDKLCEGPYVWDGVNWTRLWGDCDHCEYTIVGKDGKEYHIYCLDFIGTASQAIARCKQNDVTNPNDNGGYYTYHLMTFDEYAQIWANPEKGTNNYRFTTGTNYLMQYATTYPATEGWITVGKLYKEGSIDWGEAIGIGRAKKTDVTPITATYFSGGLPIGSTLNATYTVRCVRDN